MASLFRELLEKQAALKPDVKLYDHQQKAIDATGNNVIYAHATGSGKTLTGIAKFEKLREQGDANKALVVVPSSLRDNFSVKGVEKFTDSSFNVVGSKEEVRKGLAHNINPDTVYNIISYDIFRKDPDRYIRESGADTILTDESHRTKNEDTMTTRAFASDGFNQNIKNFIGLTGSITSNTPADLVPLVRQASRGKADIGKNKNEFIDRYAVRDNSKTYHGLADARKPIVGLKNKLQLQNELGKYIHYLSHEDIKEVANMPDTDLEVIKVPLTKDQKRLYEDMLADDPKLRKMIVKKRFETLKDEEASMAYSKLVEMRKIMNDPSSVIGGEFKSSPKLDRMVDDMEAHLNANPDGQALLLSHMIGGGIGSIEKELNERGIPYDRFIGKGNEGVTEESRQQAINDYNNRLKRVLLISGAGGEGISLNDTTFEGVFDPHFNPERMQQMEARGIRSGGLAHRPKEERVVDVNRYISTMPKTFGIFNSSLSTPDEAIYAMAQKKERQNKIVHDMLSNVRKQQEAKLGKSASDDSETMEKLATSFDARRKKQYWQILKRLYGGSDEAVNAISKSKDSGIYHGTRLETLPEILEEGLKPGRFREFGKGVFFGDNDTASLYSRRKIVGSDGFEHSIFDPKSDSWINGNSSDEAIELVLNDPNFKNNEISEGLKVRLAKPSELEGEILYPNPTTASVFDIKKGDPLSSVAQQVSIVKNNGVRNAVSDKVKKMNNDELTQRVIDLTGVADYGSMSEKSKANMIANREYKAEIENLLTPKTDSDFYKMKHFGKTELGRAFDVFETPTRNEFFFKDDVPANILKKASEKSDALAEELLEERVIPYAKNYATGSLPGQLAGWGLGAKYIKTPDTGNKAVDLAAKAGAVGLAGSIGGSLGRGASRAVSLHNRFDEDLDRDPTFEEYLKSVPIAMVPFIGGAVATPEAIVRKIEEGEKTANSLFGELLEKEAMNKVKALLSAGQLSKRDVRRVLKPRTIADDINSRISAKAKRFEENMPETMNAKKYKNMSKIDNLSNAPAVDFRKETKYQGHRNREMLNIAKKDFGGPVKINYVGDDVLDGETGVSWENGSINEAHIELPKKDARQFPYRYGNGMRTIRTLDPASAKQARTITARHEIQGELGGYDAKQRLFGRGGINKTRVEFTNMNAHDNMGIPLEDGRLASKLSPRTKHVTHVRDRQNELTFNFKGTPLNQERYMNAFNDDFTKNMNRPSWTRTPSDLQKGKMMRDASRHNTGDPNAKAVTDNIDLLNKLDQYITKKVK